MNNFNEKLHVMRDPKTFKPLHLISEKNDKGKISYFLTDEDGIAKYPLINGVFRMLDERDVTDLNKKYQKLYDKIAWVYELGCKVMLFFCKRGVKVRRDYLSVLDVKPKNRVLEVSVGTGVNLIFLPKDIDFYGLDISLGMLKQCVKKCSRKNIPATLVHTNAEILPFKDNSFDVVFHVGGINFFNDKKKAIDEMIRVAKPGARILISDETEQAAKKAEKSFIAKKFFKGRKEKITIPVDLIPNNVKDLKVKMIHQSDLKDSTKSDQKNVDELYVVSFVKPLSNSL